MNGEEVNGANNGRGCGLKLIRYTAGDGFTLFIPSELRKEDLAPYKVSELKGREREGRRDLEALAVLATDIPH